MEIKLITSQQIAPIDKDTILYINQQGELTNPSNRVFFGVLHPNAIVTAVMPITGKISTIAFLKLNGVLKTVKVKK